MQKFFERKLKSAFNLVVAKLESMADAKNLSDEMSFSFKFDKNKCVEGNNKTVNNDFFVPKQLKLNISAEDIFCSLPEEKGSFYSYDMGLDLPEIRFCDKSPELIGKEEKKRVPELELPPLEFSFTNECPGAAQSLENLNALETFFKQSELAPISEDKNAPESLQDAKPNSHYTLSEDYFLLFKIGEYRSKTPRLLSKDSFIQCLQPLLGRTSKSISKRVDRLRALSFGQKKKLLLYVRAFPVQSLHRKAVFDSNGEGIVIKQLNNKSLPNNEQEYLVKAERFVPSSTGAGKAQENYFDLGEASPDRNSFQNEEPIFHSGFERAPNPAFDRAMESEKKNSFSIKFPYEIQHFNFEAVEEKLRYLREGKEEAVFKLRNEGALQYIVEYLAWTFNISAEALLSPEMLEKSKTLGDLRNLFLAALPRQEFSYHYCDFN